MTTLRLTAVATGEEADRFVADVLKMLSAAAATHSIPLAFVTGAASRTFDASLDPSAISIFTRLVGTHRGQLAPTRMPNGRLSTAHVIVGLSDERASMSGGARVTAVRFTYNYPLGIVTDHDDGRQHALDGFLSHPPQ